MDYNGKLTINVREFNLLELSAKRRLLYNIFKDYDKQISLVHIDSIISVAKSNRGGSECVLPGNIKLKLEKGLLSIYE